MMSVYPKNGMKLHQVNDFQYRAPPSPLSKILSNLDIMRTFPSKLEHVFAEKIVKGVDEHVFINPSDYPKINNKVSKYNSRMGDNIQMLNLFDRTFKTNSKEKIVELIRVLNILSGQLKSLKAHLNYPNQVLNNYPTLRDNLNQMFGLSNTFLTRMKNILRSKGSL